MNCQRVQASFLDRHAGALPAHEAAAVSEHLKTCLTCQRKWAGLQHTLLTLDRLPSPAPSPRLRTQFYALLEETQRELDAPSPFALARSRVDAFFAALLPSRPALQFALTLALLIAGVAIGARYLQPAPERIVITQPDPATQQELAALREKVESMDHLVTTTLLQQPTTARLRHVLAAQGDGPDPASDRALLELLNTLAFDPSTNVRLAALEALYAYAARDAVRAGVLASLPREPSPLVQVAMIDFVAATRDTAATGTLHQLAQDGQLHAGVREAAQRALAQL